MNWTRQNTTPEQGRTVTRRAGSTGGPDSIAKDNSECASVRLTALMRWAAIHSRKFTTFILLPLALIAFMTMNVPLVPEQIPAHEKLGSLHGLLLLQDENGKEIAVGDQVLEVRGNEVHSRLIFRFRDGSVNDETAVFRQGRVFQLVTDHLIQKGPSFKNPADVMIDVPHGKVTWVDLSSKDKKTQSQTMQLPNDLANGMMQLMAQDFPSKASELKVSYLTLESKPRVVTFTVKPDGSDGVKVGSSNRQADRFNVYIDIGGVTGALATMVGKQPPDIKIWVLHGPSPVFLKMVGPLAPESPVWTTLLTAPQWSTDEHTK